MREMIIIIVATVAALFFVIGGVILVIKQTDASRQERKLRDDRLLLECAEKNASEDCLCWIRKECEN